MTTREKIVNTLKKRGESRADDLAEPLGLTSMAVRQHLYQLRDEGAVSCTSMPAGRGRPVKMWKLTQKSDVYFPDAHRDLSIDLIDSIRAVFGDEALNQLIEHRSENQLKDYQSATNPSNNLEEKLAMLAVARSKEGYMAEVIARPEGGFNLIENHCPICEAAKACSGLCAKELEVFKSLLGQEATIERDEHILDGARRCSYRVIEKS